MSTIYEEFQQQLSTISSRYSGNPIDELKALLLLALEREEIVSIAYRESLIASRLERMPISADVRKIILHGLSWAWKDEEMHAIYVRGAILRIGSLPLHAKTFFTQASGAFGGWAGSVNQHARWRDAPFSRLVATGMTAAGILTGKIPKAVRKHLNYTSFKDFCLFNVDAEKTAKVCWHRISELADKMPEYFESMARDFIRIEQDELNHEKLFEIFADSFDHHDHLVPGESATKISEKLTEINESFVPRSHRSISVHENPLGTGGNIFVIEGKATDDKVFVFRRLLDQSGLVKCLQERERFIKKDLTEFRIAIKPTFMLGYHRKDFSPITDPTLIEELARFLNELGCKHISVVEGPNIYDKFYENRTVKNVAEYFSVSSTYFQVVDVSQEQTEHSFDRGLAQNTISKTWKDADFRISFGKMRSHPIELSLLTVGNCEGLGNRCEDFIFIERQAHRETAVMTLLNNFPPHFALLDAFESVPDGLLGVMGCPRPKSVKRFYAGRDALALDIVAGRHTGMKSPHQSSLLQAAHHWFGDPDMKIEVIGTDQILSDWRNPYHNEFSAFLSFLSYPIYVLGSARGSLFVPEMDEEAFPPVCPPSFWLRFGRRFLQTFLGLRFPKNHNNIQDSAHS